MISAAHHPVLVDEVVEHLEIPSGGRALDLTLGLGGHAEALLSKACGRARYLGVDRDCEALAIASQCLGRDERFFSLASNYEDVWGLEGFKLWMAEHAPDGFDVVFADLGVSSLQLKTQRRGFSFLTEGPLDMRMDAENGMTALEWLERQDEAGLADVIFKFGEERSSKPISRAILGALGSGKLKTTIDLANAIYTVLPRAGSVRKKKIDPATRTFQALRIAVNSELIRLGQSIETAARALKPNGRIGIISFHSLEDRIVKQTFRRLAGIYDGPGRESPAPLPKLLQLIFPGGIAPGEAECRVNPPSRSARLRLAQRVPCLS
jgi:16S rRNA (cytosine1402-N4)-methyltransferase